ncbi:MAG: RidA family protein [Candidatus Sulfotelmatobacter sp.]|jgi:enamine deaminase RidA (YjgF/YER057c/UK114 family)
MRRIFIALTLGLFVSHAAAQTTVRHLQEEDRPIATGVWVGEMLYLSGQLAAPLTPADAAKGTAAVYGDTEAQTMSTLTKIQALLKTEGLGMGDVVMMHVYLAGDPAKGNKLDFPAMMAAYTRFFGTKEQPNKPARSAMQVAALAAPWALVEIEVIAVKGAPKPTK